MPKRKITPPPPPPTKKENPMPNFRSLKVYRKQNKFDCTLFAELRDRGHYHETSDCFEYPKNPFLNQATPKNTCQISLPKKSFDHPRHLKSRVPPWGAVMR